MSTALHIAPLAVIAVDGLPISVNSMYGTRQRGGKFLTEHARAWEHLVMLEARMWRLNCLRLRRVIPEQLQVHCRFHGVRGDADNYLKTTLDGLKMGLIIDDKHFSPVTAARGDTRAKPGAIITLWEA